MKINIEMINYLLIKRFALQVYYDVDDPSWKTINN